MKLSDYTIERGFLPRLKCRDLEEVVGRLVSRFVDAGALADGEGLVQEVLRREAADSTAIGGGLVLPHARFAGLDRVHLGAATLVEPLDLQAADGRPVDVVILLVGPQGDPREMLRVLAKLARLVKDSRFLTDLRAASLDSEFRALLSED